MVEEVNSCMIHFICCRNLCKCHNVPPPITTIKEKNSQMYIILLKKGKANTWQFSLKICNATFFWRKNIGFYLLASLTPYFGLDYNMHKAFDFLLFFHIASH
jgi:hypothetical protein